MPQATSVIVTSNWQPAPESQDLLTRELPHLDQATFLRKFRVIHAGTAFHDPDAVYRRWAANERGCKLTNSGALKRYKRSTEIPAIADENRSTRSPNAASARHSHHPKLERMVAAQNYSCRLAYADRVVSLQPSIPNRAAARNALAKNLAELVDRMVESGEWPAG